MPTGSKLLIGIGVPCLIALIVCSIFKAQMKTAKEPPARRSMWCRTAWSCAPQEDRFLQPHRDPHRPIQTRVQLRGRRRRRQQLPLRRRLLRPQREVLKDITKTADGFYRLPFPYVLFQPVITTRLPWIESLPAQKSATAWLKSFHSASSVTRRRRLSGSSSGRTGTAFCRMMPPTRPSPSAK